MYIIAAVVPKASIDAEKTRNPRWGRRRLDICLCGHGSRPQFTAITLESGTRAPLPDSFAKHFALFDTAPVRYNIIIGLGDLPCLVPSLCACVRPDYNDSGRLVLVAG